MYVEFKAQLEFKCVYLSFHRSGIRDQLYIHVIKFSLLLGIESKLTFLKNTYVAPNQPLSNAFGFRRKCTRKVPKQSYDNILTSLSVALMTKLIDHTHEI